MKETSKYKLPIMELDDYYDINVWNDTNEKVETELDRIDSSLETIVKNGFTVNPQCPMPFKKGTTSNSRKIVIKNNTDDLTIIQKTNKGYLGYKFDTLYGDSSVSSVGGNWDLIRLKKTWWLSDVYVYLKPTPTTGTLTSFIAPSVTSSIEGELFDISSFNTANTISSISGNLGIGVYYIDGSSEVIFDLNSTDNPNANILYYGSNGSSNNVDILVNGEIVKNINPRGARVSDAIGGYTIASFSVPHNKKGALNKYSVKIKNNGTGRFYFSCFNFKNLNEYNNEFVDNFKGFGTTKTWIDSSGASDYAIFDTDLGKFCGSYHGGETRETALAIYKNNLISVADIPNGFSIENNFKIYQVTNINNKGKITSEFVFDIDGTISMRCSFNGSIRTKYFYTALTCTNPGFEYVIYPHFEKINLGGEKTIFMNLGEITQYDSPNRLELTIRHTMFDAVYNKKGANILNNSGYSKYYYGAIQDLSNAESVTVNNLRFEKSLDFTIR